MALQIIQNAGVLEIKGDLTAQNTNSLKNYFDALFVRSSFIMISLNEVNDMDKACFNLLMDFYQKAVEKNKVFYIINECNLKVAHWFQSEKKDFLLQSRAA
ncbi:hypothetical protein GOQ30_07055 [Flavobacterium sp. TP390]|uniref:STAS domain-containing protein n=1 Tax=Flavobacterium profundi TaxID=1774945 RepID=A0A6I4IL09_9FLAO|nr:STAS domain-containing protein [Flavobacterium profundi]MVO08921.1 hypothetical protein [Flavobacterium profundi]